MSCQNNCGHCCGAGEIYLGRGALELLETLGQVAFLPVIEREGRDIALTGSGESGPNDVKALKINGLATVDRDIPLTNFSYDAYPDSSWRGSMALTKRGQDALESLSVQGVEE